MGAVDTNSSASLTDLAKVLMKLQQDDETRACVEDEAALRASAASEHYRRGHAFSTRGRFTEAIESFGNVIAIDPLHSDAIIYLGFALYKLGRVKDAIKFYDRAIKLVPTNVQALINRGVALKKQRQWDDAITDFERALKLAPDHAVAWHNRGDALFYGGKYQEAMASFEKALLIDPKLTEAWLGLANVRLRTAKVAQALDACEQAVQLAPDAPNTLLMMGQCHAAKGDAETAVQFFDRALVINPSDEVVLFNRIFSLDFCRDADFAAHQNARAEWWRRIGREIHANVPQRHENNRDPSRRIVLGYVSAEFRNRSAAANFLPVIGNHDKTRFEIICYSGAPTEDEVTALFRNSADQWRNISQWSDDELKQCIRRDQVDILIDLSGPAEYNRLRTFAGKPAPIQVTAWGHATGTGQPTIDYLFSDPWLVPREVRHLFAERIYDLPCFAIIQAPPDELRSHEPPMTSNGHLTYGVFNRISKISDAAIVVWARILQSDPRARLVIKDHGLSEAYIRDLLTDRFARQGIAKERLDLIGGTSRADHLKAYGQVDVCLDPFPHCGGVATWEALYMGVPVVTKSGNSITQRLGGAILSAIGLTEWIALDDERYIAIAANATLDRLRVLRRKIPDMINTRCAPIDYTRAVEEAYQAIWRNYCNESENRSHGVSVAGEGSPSPVTTAREVDVVDLCARAQTLHRHGKLVEARSAYKTILEQCPGHFEAIYMLGVCERQSGSFEAAVDLLRHALLLDPRCAPALSELGLALEALQRHDEALACFDRLINLKPDFIEAHYNRGNVLLASGRLEQAVASFDDMIRLDPNHVSAWNNRGNALSRLDKLEQAVASYDKALSLKPKHVSALVNRGSVLLKRADVEAAIASYDRSLAVKPDDENTLSNRIFALDFLARSDFASHQAARSQWWDRIGAKIAAERVVQHDNDFNPDKRITLGYVSADFRRHSAAYIFRPVLQCHDRSCFEVICYNNTVAEDDVTFAFRNLANRWRDIQQWSDDQLAECIRTDKVDILIDLSGHTGGNRLRVFALKPAPVQVTAWGHATGTGLPTIDYLFADPVLIPPEVRPLFAEQIYDLPCVIAIEPPSAEFRSSQPPVVNNGFLTFGVFNRVSKISDAAIATWSGIMHSLSSAQLLIKDHTLSDSSVQNLLREKFACHGVAPDRLRLIGATSREQHLAAYGQVDMCLDPFPHGGGVSTWEALHMGVPVVAKLGNTMPERLSGAILSAIGLTDWVADDDDEYVEIALRAEPDQLSMLRRELPDIIASRCGPVPYTRAVENAFRAMWRKCCEAKEALV